MDGFIFHAADEGDTSRLGTALEGLLPPGTVLALRGTLGAGKTRLVQAIATAAGVPQGTVVSPTFVLIQEYQGRRAIYHFDAYRLADHDEFLALGPEEYFDSEGLSIVEWADRVETCLPAQRVEVEIEVTGENTRRFTIRALGERLAGLVDRLRALPALTAERKP